MEYQVKTIRMGIGTNDPVKMEEGTCWVCFNQTEDALELLRNLPLYSTVKLTKKNV